MSFYIRSWTLLAAFGGSYAPGKTDKLPMTGASGHKIALSHSITIGAHRRSQRLRCPEDRVRVRVRVGTRCTYVHRYCACAALRANVAARIRNRVSPAESAFSLPVQSPLLSVLLCSNVM